jgi:hypothetical protein
MEVSGQPPPPPPFDRSLCGPQGEFGRCGENSCSYRESNLAVQPDARTSSDGRSTQCKVLADAEPLFGVRMKLKVAAPIVDRLKKIVWYSV